METIVVLGGGYAGIHTVKALRAVCGKHGVAVRILLMDKEAYHVKKVRLVQAAAFPVRLRVGFGELFERDEAVFMQGTASGVDPVARTIQYINENGECCELAYDRLVLTLGSVVRRVPESQGGFTLSSEHEAERIRAAIDSNLRIACAERDSVRREALSSVTVVGAGISGVETAAEIARAMAKKAAELGLPNGTVRVNLVTGNARIVERMPATVADQLSAHLNKIGVSLVNEARVAYTEPEGAAVLADGRRLPSGCTIWTIGIEPNPVLKQFGLPLDEAGRLITDSWYRVEGYDTIYAIGDNARIIDSSTGLENGMTCREAIQQAGRLAMVVTADMTLRSSAPHQAPTRNQYCVSLGGGEGFVWMRKWGIDWTMTGTLAGKVREYTWNTGSFMK
jgi:NADH:ubiquinone reductase (H+-translocating)